MQKKVKNLFSAAKGKTEKKDLSYVTNDWNWGRMY